MKCSEQKVAEGAGFVRRSQALAVQWGDWLESTTETSIESSEAVLLAAGREQLEFSVSRVLMCATGSASASRRWGRTGKASAAQPINECVAEHRDGPGQN